MKKLFFIWMAVSLFYFGCKKTDTSNPIDVEVGQELWATALTLNNNLGRGMNFGNTYEGDTWVHNLDKSYLKIIADLGFKHVRIPILWNRSDRALLTAPFTIQPEFLNEIKSVVDAALQNKLHIIINVHHDDALNADPEGQKERLLSYWKQIATYFSSYPDSVLFEVLNEPHNKITPDIWNNLFAETLNTIRQISPKRCVLMGVADWGGLGSVDKLLIPDDPYVILSVHYYNPFQFTHQGAEWIANANDWLGTKWYDTQTERNTVISDFKKVVQIAKDKNVPIHVGEFGTYEKADMDSRVRWTRFMSRYFEEQGWSWAYWEFYSSFGIYDPVTNQLRMPLTNALTKDAMPTAYEPTIVKTLYTSNFLNGQNDGWNLHNHDASAASTITIADAKINVSITKPGDFIWQMQLIRNGFSIESGKSYIVKFNAVSTAEKTIYCAVSKESSPWTSYSATLPFTINAVDATYSLLFTSNTTDSYTNIVFSIGAAGTTPVTIYNISLQEVSF